MSEYIGEDWIGGEGMELASDPSYEGARLDAFLADKTELTRSAAVRLIENGHVLVNGRREVKKYKMRATDSVTVQLPEAEPTEAEAENIPLDIVYEDGDIVVINKPKGIVVHPAPGNPRGTLVNGLLYHCQGSLSGIGGVIRPGIVHRIDKDTQGLLVVAKNDAAHLYLAERIKTHEIRRIYHAIALGNFKVKQKIVQKYLVVEENHGDKKEQDVLVKVLSVLHNGFTVVLYLLQSQEILKRK